MKHGAAVNIRDVNGDTPLHFSAQWAGRDGAAELIDLLLRSGEDEEAANNGGERPAGVVGQLGIRHFANLERPHNLLAAAPTEKAWRRRSLLLLCRARHNTGQVVITGDGSMRRSNDPQESGSIGPAGGGTMEEKAGCGWTLAVAWVVGGAGAE